MFNTALVRASDADDEWGPDKDGPIVIESHGVGVAEPQPDQVVEIQRLRKALVDSFAGTDRGLKANSETRAEIVELIT
ncbi:hypothetical protein V6N13_040013 [Hibiscus sabdariffa]